MKKLYLFLLLIPFYSTYAQPNCEAYKYLGDMVKYEACKKAMEIKGHYQFSKEYQTILDEAIKIDPTFDYAYWAKSVAYLKSGDFVTWKKLIDKAVELNPEGHLGYRGWCRYQFFRDYEGAIRDIEKLDSLVTYDIGQSQNGTYHLNIAKGLCYKAIGEKEKAIRIMEDQIKLNIEEDFMGTYDYLHLGVLYLETNDPQLALAAFEKQSDHNELAENQYYSALAYKALRKQDEYKTGLEKAKKLYLEGNNLSDPYLSPMDKIYLKNIEDELEAAVH
ncbi:tetratricopeptide repeat protein [Salinimicrobium flavum]|uniref:Tetratricopeptide repeat protein n=1 Tax=Salinimicrobium flavum TaxID=1737065 RepID=A0ABW5IWT1_9FLAO